jgi:hypothetical protein
MLETLTLQLIIARQNTLELIADADWATVVHPASGWTIKDIVTHLTFWEEIDTLLLRHFAENLPVEIKPEWKDFEATNLVVQEQRKEYSHAKALADYQASHAKALAILEKMPVERETELMQTSWGEMMTLEAFVETMLRHEAGHRIEIQQALGVK